MAITFKLYPFGKHVQHHQIGSEAEMSDLLGGKGRGLHLMAHEGLPVPPGVVIPTSVSRSLSDKNAGEVAGFVMEELLYPVLEEIEKLTEVFGYQPLVSVRSGAPVSMPGMMDTVLNVGICRDNIDFYASRIGGKRAAYDSYRRLIHMLAVTAFGVPAKAFETKLEGVRKFAGVESDSDLNLMQMKTVCNHYEALFQAEVGYPFPQNFNIQLAVAISAVFDSWSSERAKYYRKMNDIPDDMGTAVNVQAMVFGNANDDSGTGVFFTRNPNTGDDEVYGEFLRNAQGEDVVAGIRTPNSLDEMADLGGVWVKVAQQLLEMSGSLEELYKDVVDAEFTVQDGHLWMLQSRVGKRTPAAAVSIACQLIEEGKVALSDIGRVLTWDQWQKAKRVTVNESLAPKPSAVGLPASAGVVAGLVVLTSDQAVAQKEKGIDVILFTKETTPDDIHGMDAAVGILTLTGGLTSHAAVVSRAMNTPCVVGLKTAPASLIEGSTVTICGTTGRVWVGVDVPVATPKDNPAIEAITGLLCKGYEGPVYVPTVAGSDQKHPALSKVLLGAVEFTKQVKKLKKTDKATLDFREELDFLQDSDLDLINGLGGGSDKAGFVSTRVYNAAALEAFGLSDREIVLGEYVDPKSFASLGCKLDGPARTVKDLVTGAGTRMSDDIVASVFGDRATMEKVLGAMDIELKSFTLPVTQDMVVEKILKAKG
jgi:pyruvate,phosphate dikinase